MAFGTLKYVHVSVDTFSGAVFASCHTGEKARDVRKHFLAAFASLGVPRQIKTDNGPAYVSVSLFSFFQQWGVKHLTGIPHSPTGRAVVERRHGTLKRLLQQQKGGEGGYQSTPHKRLNKALYAMNLLNISPVSQVPPILRHFSSQIPDQQEVQGKAQVLAKNLESGNWEGPDPLITWGRGYACVSTGHGPRWLLARCVRPYLRCERQLLADTQEPAVGAVDAPVPTVCGLFD